jgi:hypothetical protein
MEAKIDDPKLRATRDYWANWLINLTDTNDIYFQNRHYILGKYFHCDPSADGEATPPPCHCDPSDDGEATPPHHCNPRKTPIPTGILIVDYSPKSIALFGNTKPIKQQLLDLHGSFNRHLRYNNEPTPGWVFSKKRESAIRQLIAS